MSRSSTSWPNCSVRTTRTFVPSASAESGRIERARKACSTSSSRTRRSSTRGTPPGERRPRRRTVRRTPAASQRDDRGGSGPHQDRTWTFGHVIVDEAQELSAMDWRLLMRRSPNRSMTLVGDVAQTGAAGGARSWGEVLSPYVARPVAARGADRELTGRRRRSWPSTSGRSRSAPRAAAGRSPIQRSSYRLMNAHHRPPRSGRRHRTSVIDRFGDRRISSRQSIADSSSASSTITCPKVQVRSCAARCAAGISLRRCWRSATVRRYGRRSARRSSSSTISSSCSRMSSAGCAIRGLPALGGRTRHEASVSSSPSSSASSSRSGTSAGAPLRLGQG